VSAPPFRFGLNDRLTQIGTLALFVLKSVGAALGMICLEGSEVEWNGSVMRLCVKSQSWMAADSTCRDSREGGRESRVVDENLRADLRALGDYKMLG